MTDLSAARWQLHKWHTDACSSVRNLAEDASLDAVGGLAELHEVFLRHGDRREFASGLTRQWWSNRPQVRNAQIC